MSNRASCKTTTPKKINARWARFSLLKLAQYLTLFLLHTTGGALFAAADTKAPLEPASSIRNQSVNPILTHAADLWIRGDLLLWQMSEDNLINCYVINSDLTLPHRDFRNIHFDWDFGCRVGAGYTFPHDGWDTALFFAHYATAGKSSVKNEGGDHIPSPAWGPADVNSTTLELDHSKADFHFDLNQIDFGLGRSYYISKYFTLRPNFGLRSTWIHQKLHFDYENTDPDLSVKGVLKNAFWGFGFTLGLAADWKFTKHWSLYGETDYAILLGQFDLDQTGERVEMPHWKQKKIFDSGKGILDISAGFKYLVLFAKDRLAWTFRAGYEYHLYFNQNQFLISNGSNSFENFNTIKGNLAFQGVMLSGQFDF